MAVQPWPPGFFPLPLGDLRPPQLPLEDDERAEKWYAGWKGFFFWESLPGLRRAKGMSFKAFKPSWDKNWVFFLPDDACHEASQFWAAWGNFMETYHLHYIDVQ